MANAIRIEYNGSTKQQITVDFPLTNRNLHSSVNADQIGQEFFAQALQVCTELTSADLDVSSRKVVTTVVRTLTTEYTR